MSWDATVSANSPSDLRPWLIPRASDYGHALLEYSVAINRKVLLCSGSQRVPQKCTDLDLNLLYLLILETHCKITRKIRFLALGVCLLKICSNASRVSQTQPRQCHVYITTDQLIRFHNNEFDEMPCKLESTNDLLVQEIPNDLNPTLIPKLRVQDSMLDFAAFEFSCIQIEVLDCIVTWWSGPMFSERDL